MYTPTIPVLISAADEQGLYSELRFMYSNGSYLRSDRGGKLAKLIKPLPDRILFVSQYCGRKLIDYIRDPLLVQRIKAYFAWHEERHTNCSSFAHYLTTGRFATCDDQAGRLVLEQGLRPIETTSKVGIGDMVCIVYLNDQVAKRRSEFKPELYRYFRQERVRSKGFLKVNHPVLKCQTYEREDLLWLICQDYFADYHFMVCVGINDGRPVWLSQVGRRRQGDLPAKFAITLGNEDPYFEHTPFITLIKKRR